MADKSSKIDKTVISEAIKSVQATIKKIQENETHDIDASSMEPMTGEGNPGDVPGNADGKNPDVASANANDLAAIARVSEELEDEMDKEKLSESIKTKIHSLIEAKVASKFKTLKEENEAEFAKKEDELLDQMDAYADEVVQEWVKENKVAIQESYMSRRVMKLAEGLKKLFKENNVDIDSDTSDIIDGYKSENDELRNELNEAISRNASMKKVIAEGKKALVLEKVLTAKAGLAKTQILAIRKLAESTEYESDEQFLNTLDKKVEEELAGSDNHDTPITIDNPKEMNNVGLDAVVPATQSGPTLEEAIAKFRK